MTELPTTQSNAHALAASHGYTLTEIDGAITISAGGSLVCAVSTWRDAIRWLAAAEPLSPDDPAAA